jgi:hypothetical protein
MTAMYVTSSTRGTPSSGVCVLMNRRPVWSSRRRKTSSSVRSFISSQGDSSEIGTPRLVESCSSIPTMVCIHVVPDFDGVEITTSPGRSVNRSQRALSAKTPW